MTLFELFVVLMDHFADITFGSALQTTYNDLFWSEIVFSQITQRVEPALYITVDANGNPSLEEAIKAWAVEDDPDSPRHGQLRWLFGRLSSMLIIQARRFQYNVNTDSIEKVSHTC